MSKLQHTITALVLAITPFQAFAIAPRPAEVASEVQMEASEILIETPKTFDCTMDVVRQQGFFRNKKVDVSVPSVTATGAQKRALTTVNARLDEKDGKIVRGVVEGELVLIGKVYCKIRK